ncbi:MAG: FxSxx-COOH system tetratricopeptide repeat protein [Streptosporangiaceae bacterium]
MRTGQVFINHTSDMAQFPDDRPFVQAALDAVGRTGMAPVDMRHFAARDGSPADYCQQRVRECEIYVAVVGFQYGSLVPGEDVSYTELEFRAASLLGVPRLIFLLDDTACPAGFRDADSGRALRFRQQLRDAGLIVRSFTSGDGLELEVFHALSELAGRIAVPQIWNVPNRNADFTGRENILERLHDELAGDGTAVVLARAVHGLGGVGKTQVALEYAHRFKADYRLIWWINAEQPLEISLALAELAGRLGLHISDNAAEAAAAALEQLRRDIAGLWLLIFDNAEDPEDLASFLPHGSGHILITSRNPAWTRHAEPVELDVFSRQESLAHLMHHVRGLDTRDAARVSAAVGDLPLAIEQAAAWLAETVMPAALYAELLETQTTSALAFNKPPDYAKPVVAAWNLSIERLRNQYPASVRFLQILAFCSPDPISTTLLYNDAMLAALRPYDETLTEKSQIGQVIRNISHFALLKIDNGTNSVQIHRLVQTVIHSQMTEEEQAEARHEVHKILAGARPPEDETDDPAAWSIYDIIWPHLGPSAAERCRDPQVRQLLIDWVRFQWKHGEFEACLNLARRIENLWRPHLEADHPQTLRLQFLIGNALRTRGQFKEARDLDTFVLERQRIVLGPDHPHTLMTANSRAADLRAMGEAQEALISDRDTHERSRDQLGEDHERTLAAAHNLGCCLRLVGDYLTARRLDEETLVRQRRVLGPDHLSTLLSAATLALDLRAEGAFHESVHLLRHTWGRYREILGDDVLDTLRTAGSLAASLHKVGQQPEAMTLARDTLERCQRRYGRGVPEFQMCELNMAWNYAAAGDMTRAIDLVKKARSEYQATLGDDHPNTLVASNNLACYLQHSSGLPEALALMGDTLDRMRRKLGDRHPLTLSCMVNLANCRGDSGDLEVAEALEIKAIPVLREVLGDDHPDTLVCQANLAVTQHQTGRASAAEELRYQILARFRQTVGPSHPLARSLQAWQRIHLNLEALPI